MQDVVSSMDSIPRRDVRRHLIDGIKSLLKSAAVKLKGSARRRF
nr:hypothetical protein [Desulfoferrobacter suflitae]